MMIEILWSVIMFVCLYLVFFGFKNPFTDHEKCEILSTSNDKEVVMKEIVNAKADECGIITEVLLEGETEYISVKEAIELTKAGKINAEVIVKPITIEYLRTKADGIVENNLDFMAKNNC